VDEYFSSGEVAALSAALEELEAPQFMYWAVKKLVTLAMDKRPHEREMASVALSALYGDAVSGDQMQTGFIKLLEAVGELRPAAPAPAARCRALRGTVCRRMQRLRLGLGAAPPAAPGLAAGTLPLHDEMWR
jgi:hypothetical protein